MFNAFEYHITFTGFLNSSAYSVMQYTGRKDKNAKEIYEGDIIKYSIKNFMGGEYATDYSKKPIPKYSKGIAEIIWKYNGFYMQNLKIPNVSPAIFNNNEIEVIGNIYENPELINHQTK